MKTTTLLLSLFIGSFITVSASASKCKNVIEAAHLTVTHSKKAFNAETLGRRNEWIDKAILAFRTIEQKSSKCSCEDVSQYAFEGYRASVKSKEQQGDQKWADFYAKRAYKKAILTANAIEACTGHSFIFKASELKMDDELLTASIDDEIILEDMVDTSYTLRDLEVDLRNEIEVASVNKSFADIAYEGMQNSYLEIVNDGGCAQAYEQAMITLETNRKKLEADDLSSYKKKYISQINGIVEEFVFEFQKCSKEGF